MTKRDILTYEVCAAWWPQFVSNPILQRVVGKYFAWKVGRKWGRFQAMVEMKERVQNFTNRPASNNGV